MKWLTVSLCLILVLTSAGHAQDFLGKWKVVRIFTTANLQKDEDNRMLLLASEGENAESDVEGLIVPKDMAIEFSISPKNKVQHVTLTSGGMLLMSLNWKIRDQDPPQAAPGDLTLKIWSDDEMEYDIYSLLYNDQKTLVFTDRSKTGQRFLDIYYLEKVE